MACLNDFPCAKASSTRRAASARSVTPVKLMNSSMSSSRVLLGGEGGGVGGSGGGGGGAGLLKCCGTAWRDWYIVCQPERWWSWRSSFFSMFCGLRNCCCEQPLLELFYLSGFGRLWWLWLPDHVFGQQNV